MNGINVTIFIQLSIYTLNRQNAYNHLLYTFNLLGPLYILSVFKALRCYAFKINILNVTTGIKSKLIK